MQYILYPIEESRDILSIQNLKIRDFGLIFVNFGLFLAIFTPWVTPKCLEKVEQVTGMMFPAFQSQPTHVNTINNDFIMTSVAYDLKF